MISVHARTKTEYYQVLKDMGIHIHMIVGNHTVYYKNTNKVNTPSLLLDSFDNITIYDEVTDVEIDGGKFTMLPWINQENEEQVKAHLKNTDSDIVCGHLELNGFVDFPVMCLVVVGIKICSLNSREYILDTSIISHQKL